MIGPLSRSDAELLVEFLSFLKKHSHLLDGYNANVPIEGYILVACVAVIVFDYLCTFDQEVNHVWSCPWSFGLPLFYINRYVPVVVVALCVYTNSNHMSAAACNRTVQVATWLISASSFFSQLIIVLRTCALWHNNTFIVTALLLLLIVAFALSSMFTAKQMASMSFAPTPSFIRGCFIVEGLDNASLYVYVILFVCEFIIIALTIIKAFQHLRRNRTSWLSQLYKNGIFFCICMLFFSSVNIGAHLAPRMPYIYRQVVRVPQHVFHSIFSNRVVLQILEYRHRFAQERRRRLSSIQGVSTNYVETTNVFTTVMMDSNTTRSSDMELSLNAANISQEQERRLSFGHNHLRFLSGINTKMTPLFLGEDNGMPVG